MGTYSTVLLVALVALSARLSAAAPSTAFTDVTATETLEPITVPTAEEITVTVPEVSVVTEEPVTVTVPDVSIVTEEPVTVTVPDVSVVTENPVTVTVPDVSIVTEDPVTVTIPDVSIVTEDPVTVTVPDVSSVTEGSGESTVPAGSDATDGTDGTDATDATDGVTVSDRSGATVTIPEGSGDCDFLVDLITVDKDTNSSLLTDAISEAWATWDASFQAKFSSFKAEIEGIVFGSGVPCFADKLEKIASIIGTWAPDGSEDQKVVFGIYIRGWGQLKKLVDCVDDGDLGGSGELPGCEDVKH
ncbi:hypothetical protein AAVH_18264 [Aphelenchoides avenae]|nr:hypothetical protein AAVH_18264 [Aphelenchus avenae]